MRVAPAMVCPAGAGLAASRMGGARYAVMMVLQLVWVLRVMPETKGVPLEDIQKRLGIA